MREIIKSNFVEQGAEKSAREIGELKKLPASVRDYFEKLPDAVKNKIFPAAEKIEFKNSPEKSLEEIVAGLDAKTREEFMARCSSELFENGRFKFALEAIGEENLKLEVMRLFDLLWQNRGKKDDVLIFNQEYYNDFFSGRTPMTERIKEKQLEIKKLRASIDMTIRQKRLTKRKNEELRELNSELDLITGDLKKYDSQNGNSELDRLYFRDILSRQRKERDWTKGVAIVTEYLDPAEFATIMAERLDRIFHKETAIVDLIAKATEEWYAIHKEDGIFKESARAKSEGRQAVLINYFRALVGSYLRGKESERTDAEMYYTIIQMEICLNMLNKK